MKTKDHRIFKRAILEGFTDSLRCPNVRVKAIAFGSLKLAGAGAKTFRATYKQVTDYHEFAGAWNGRALLARPPIHPPHSPIHHTLHPSPHRTQRAGRPARARHHANAINSAT